jgi:hypothetical protein
MAHRPLATGIACPTLTGMSASEVHASLAQYLSFIAGTFNTADDAAQRRLILVFIGKLRTPLALKLAADAKARKFVPDLAPPILPDAVDDDDDADRPAQDAHAHDARAPPPPLWSDPRLDWDHPDAKAVILAYLRHLASGGGDTITLDRAVAALQPGLVIPDQLKAPDAVFVFAGMIADLNATTNLNRLYLDATPAKRLDFIHKAVGPPYNVALRHIIDDATIPGSINALVLLITESIPQLKLAHAYELAKHAPASANASPHARAAPDRDANRRGAPRRGHAQAVPSTTPDAPAPHTSRAPKFVPKDTSAPLFCRNCQVAHPWGAHVVDRATRIQNELAHQQSRTAQAAALAAAQVAHTASPSHALTLAPTTN